MLPMMTKVLLVISTQMLLVQGTGVPKRVLPEFGIDIKSSHKQREETSMEVVHECWQAG